MKLTIYRGWTIFVGVIAALAIALCVYLALGGMAFRDYGNYADNNPPASEMRRGQMMPDKDLRTYIIEEDKL